MLTSIFRQGGAKDALPQADRPCLAQAASIRHIGPMAQDFYAAFGLGETDTGISTVDADGVALAAIQGLYTVVQEKDARIAALEETVANQQAEFEARLRALESASQVETSARRDWAGRDVSTGAETSHRDVSTGGYGQLLLGLPWALVAGLGLLNLGGAAGYALARRKEG